MHKEYQDTTCVLCNKPAKYCEYHVFEKEYQCSKGHHFIISDLAKNILAGTSNAMEGARLKGIEWLETVPPGKILFILTTSTEEQKLNPNHTMKGEYRTYQE